LCFNAAMSSSVEEAVRNLTGRYCAAVVDFDREVFGACWMADAQWHAKGNIIEGRERIVRVFEKLRRQYSLCVQELLSGVIETVSETEASATWQIRELQFPIEGAGVQLLGIYADRCVLHAGQWQFASRSFRELYRGPLDTSGALSVT
jgi:SnoaL-like domain